MSQGAEKKEGVQGSRRITLVTSLFNSGRAKEEVVVELEGGLKPPRDFGLEMDAVTNNTVGPVVWKLLLGRDVFVNVY